MDPVGIHFAALWSYGIRIGGQVHPAEYSTRDLAIQRDASFGISKATVNEFHP
jgi:hypothetical protein